MMREGAHHDRKAMTMQLQVNTSISTPGMNMNPEKSHFFMIEITLHMRHFTERIESFELMSCCFIIQVLKKNTGYSGRALLSDHKQPGKTSSGPVVFEALPWTGICQKRPAGSQSPLGKSGGARWSSQGTSTASSGLCPCNCSPVQHRNTPSKTNLFFSGFLGLT